MFFFPLKYTHYLYINICAIPATYMLIFKFTNLFKTYEQILSWSNSSFRLINLSSLRFFICQNACPAHLWTNHMNARFRQCRTEKRRPRRRARWTELDTLYRKCPCSSFAAISRWLAKGTKTKHHVIDDDYSEN